MKYITIIITILLCPITLLWANGEHDKLVKDMQKKDIDSIKITYSQPQLFSTLYIIIDRDSAQFMLDTLRYDEKSRKNDFVCYPIVLNDKSREYILSCINAFFISKTNKIFIQRKKNNFWEEANDNEIREDIYYKNKRRKRKEMILGDIYDTEPGLAGGETVLYTRDFRRFIQFLTFITTSNGSYSESYHIMMKTITDKRYYPTYEIFDFSPYR